MYYGAIKTYDVANGPGIRVSLFVSGCRNHCEGCFQPETWNFNYGSPYTQDTEDHILRLLSDPFVTGFTVLGGDPMEPENTPYVAKLLKRVKEELPHISIWLYSGYLLENLIEKDDPNIKYILDSVNVLVDGPFILEKRDLALYYRGSSNQRLLQNVNGEFIDKSDSRNLS